MHRSLVADEFYDAEADRAVSGGRRDRQGQYGEVMIGFHAPTRKTYAMKRQSHRETRRARYAAQTRHTHLQEPALTYIPVVFDPRACRYVT